MQQNKQLHKIKIYMVRQFGYVHGVVRILLFIEKNTRCGKTIFFSHSKQYTKLWGSFGNVGPVTLFKFFGNTYK